ncbi:MAG: hypothetical protein WAT79_13245 [Saprospiraceae bacterium]
MKRILFYFILFLFGNNLVQLSAQKKPRKINSITKNHYFDNTVAVSDTSHFILAQNISEIKIRLDEVKNFKREKNCFLKDSIIKLQDSLIFLLLLKNKRFSEVADSLQNLTSIGEFFGKSDSTVFSTNFIKCDIEFLSECNKNQYNVIRLVRDLDIKLDSISYKILDIEKQEYFKNLPEKTRRLIIKNNIEKNLSEAEDIIDKIDYFDISMLSRSQQLYYRPKLIDRFNSFLRLTFIDE